MSFLEKYAHSGISRFHMPGHKGKTLHGLEALDITEIRGADYLYEAEGIIGQSERITADLYGAADTLYSTEGSSLSIKAMLGVAVRCSGKEKLRIAAARNCHRAFLNGCILLDIEPVWIYPERSSYSICACEITTEDVENTLSENPDCAAVYVTSPDYYGNMADIKGISEVCKKYGAFLLVDNAHGAYLKFAGEGLHPLEQGADICCDSAHKTLPVYTGGGYLHISKTAPQSFSQCARDVMSMFSSTSPSYLIMGSLDKCAAELSSSLPEKIRRCCERCSQIKDFISDCGWQTGGDEPMKITVFPNEQGYSGTQFADILRGYKIECEYSDTIAVVLMPSPYNSEEDFARLEKAFADIPKKSGVSGQQKLLIPRAQRVMSLRKAAFSPSEEIPCDEAVGRVCARGVLSCQPSVPVITGGEVFSEEIIKILKNYSIFSVNVIK